MATNNSQSVVSIIKVFKQLLSSLDLIIVIKGQFRLYYLVQQVNIYLVVVRITIFMCGKCFLEDLLLN